MTNFAGLVVVWLLHRPATRRCSTRDRAREACARARCALASLLALAGPASAHATLLANDPQPAGAYETSPKAIVLRFSEPVEVSIGDIRLFDGRRTAHRHRGSGAPERQQRRSAGVDPEARRRHVRRHVAGDLGRYAPGRGGIHVPGRRRRHCEERVRPGGSPAVEPGGSAAVGTVYGVDRAGGVRGARGPHRQRGVPRGRVPARAIDQAVAGSSSGRGGSASWSPPWWGSGSKASTRRRCPSPRSSTRACGATPSNEVRACGTAADRALVVAFPLIRRLLGRGAARPPVWWIALASLVGIGLSLMPALAGHASTGRWVPLAIPADTVHVGAMACWLGGLVVVFAVVRPAGTPKRCATLVRFGPCACGRSSRS